MPWKMDESWANFIQNFNQQYWTKFFLVPNFWFNKISSSFVLLITEIFSLTRILHLPTVWQVCRSDIVTTFILACYLNHVQRPALKVGPPHTGGARTREQTLDKTGQALTPLVLPTDSKLLKIFKLSKDEIFICIDF